MRGRRLAQVGLLLLLLGTSVTATPAGTQDFNGVGSWEPAGTRDAPIIRQFAFIENTLTQYVVLTPELFLTDQHKARIYQFPLCSALDPVLEHHRHVPGDGGLEQEHDAPTRQLVNVVLTTGCSVQPKSEEEVLDLAAAVAETPLWVNAPLLPENVDDYPDERLFNAPPYRPRIDAWMAGEPRRFITYETNWHGTWAASSFPAVDVDTFIISYGPTFRPGWTIYNTAPGAPNHESVRSYSPIWKANCVVDAVNRKCMVSVNQEVPGYHQCRSVAECLTMVNENTGKQVDVIAPPLFTHVNCPIVAVDLDGDDYLAITEEIAFPDLWVTGPVIA